MSCQPAMPHANRKAQSMTWHMSYRSATSVPATSSSSNTHVPVLATASQCVPDYQCSPWHPPHSVLVLAVSSTTWCDGTRHVSHHVVYQCSPRHATSQPISRFCELSFRYLFLTSDHLSSSVHTTLNIAIPIRTSNSSKVGRD